MAIETIAPGRKSVLASYIESSGTVSLQDDWLLQAMDVALVESGNKDLWRPIRKHFRASSLGKLCIRQLGFEALGHGTVFPARTLRIFNTGNKVEEGKLEMMAEAGILDDSDIKIYHSSPPILGFGDAVVRHPVTGKKYVVEIKSMKQEIFRKLPNPSPDPAVNLGNLLPIQRNYVAQGNYYSCVLGESDIWVLMIENKNDSQIRTYWMANSKELLDEGLGYCRASWKTVKNETLPGVPQNRDPKGGRDPYCKRCDHQSVCAATDMGEVAYSKLRDDAVKVEGV